MAPLPFYGRSDELNLLERAFRSTTSELWVVYGRRRVGKTTLLERFTRDKHCFFFTAGTGDSRSEIRRFVGELAEHAAQPLLARLRPTNWSEALEALNQHITSTQSKAVVVLDEFQWMCRGTSSTLSDLQRLWDKHWKPSRRVHLVLCGSAVSFMVGEVLTHRSPLFGRRTGDLHLEPLNMREASPFFGRRNLFERAEALICLGGIPDYLERIASRPTRSIRQVLDELAFQRGGYLVDEAKYMLSEQLDQVERYQTILSLLSSSPRSTSDLATSLSLNRGQIDFYMNRLRALEFVDKHYPITKSAQSKTLRWRLRDEYLRFYFQFIEPNLTRIRSSKREYRFDRVTRESWDTFLGLGFEHLVSRNWEILEECLDTGVPVRRVGSYWHRPTKKREGVQIDLVIEQEDNVTLLVECKWSRKPVGTATLDELERKVKLYPNPREHTLQPVLVAAAGVSRAASKAGLPIVTLRDLFDA